MPGGRSAEGRHGDGRRGHTVGVQVTRFWEQTASGETVQQPLHCHHMGSEKQHTDLSHDHVCEFLAGLVEAQASCNVHKAPQLLQFLPWQAAQPSSKSSAGQTVRSRVSTGSGASRRLMVPLVTALTHEGSRMGLPRLAATRYFLLPTSPATSENEYWLKLGSSRAFWEPERDCDCVRQPRSPMSLSTGGGTLGITVVPVPAVR
ncbi:hypothetical protein EYF80_029264 [Liparis tanakae]|uniref:Uncharacterized protein n=1 Tax=Liparis tanakae TaxID=230148 RepID=A0A4Z2H4I5_9TELE|nr:hypothetical protein EYF80_029264 [Liparis tanakae]